MRPIVDYSDSPAAELAIFLKKCLYTVNDNKYDVKNAQEVCDRLKGVKLKEDETMISFDVISLFPSIPIIASIVLNFLLDIALKEIPYKMKICLKYVDDIFAIIPKKFVDITLHKLNKLHPKIQFTTELENNNMLPYLDLCLIRGPDGTILHDWYMKDVAVGKMLNFHSNHPRYQIMNTATNLLKRAISLSSPQFVNKNVERAKTMLSENSFPAKSIAKMVHKVFHTTNTSNALNHTCSDSPNRDSPTDNRIQSFRSIPFCKNITDNITNILMKNCPQLKIAHKPLNQLRNEIFSNMKQKITFNDRTNVIYMFSCDGDGNNNCDFSYIGETKNELYKRMGQHKNDVRKVKEQFEKSPNVQFDTVGKTAVVTHFLQTKHTPRIDDVRIQDTEKNRRKRQLIESLHVTANKTYNIKRDFDLVTHVYRKKIATIGNVPIPSCTLHSHPYHHSNSSF